MRAEEQLLRAREKILRLDSAMAELFERRMAAVSEIGEYKRQKGLPIYDPAREQVVLTEGQKRIGEEALRPYYAAFLREIMSISRAWQERSMPAPGDGKRGDVRALSVLSTRGAYRVWVGRGVRLELSDVLDAYRRVLIVTDDGVPEDYAAQIAGQCCPGSAVVVTLAAGEASKSPVTVERLCARMLSEGFDRHDCVVAVGGGVVGDVSGFAASCYMRGVDFYNVPTTLLAQIDASVGGKTAVNLGGVKNVMGAFYPPRGVFIDPEVLETLPPRQLAAGLAEAIKMGLTSDAALFELIERENPADRDVLDRVIWRALCVKTAVVEADEYDAGRRQVLNFGHTIGHGVESAMRGAWLHGEAVAVGMLPMCATDVRTRLIGVLRKCALPTEIPGGTAAICDAIAHDKKCAGDLVTVVFVPRVGEHELRHVPVVSLCDEVRCFADGTGTI